MREPIANLDAADEVDRIRFHATALFVVTESVHRLVPRDTANAISVLIVGIQNDLDTLSERLAPRGGR